jgi:hypothetical protein
VQINYWHNKPQSLSPNRITRQLHATFAKETSPGDCMPNAGNYVGAWRHPNKINVSIEACSTLGNNAPAVLYNRGILDDD